MTLCHIRRRCAARNSLARVASAVALAALLSPAAIAAHVAAPDRTSVGSPGLPAPVSSDQTVEGSFKVAAKLGSALRGAAAGSRITRERKREDKEDQSSEKSAEPAADADTQNSEAPSGGPFKVEIPGRSADTPAPAAPAIAAPPAASSGPVRTLVDRSAPAGPSPGPSPAPGPATQSTDVAGSDPSCIAGCYAPTSAHVGRTSAVRLESPSRRAAEPAASAPANNTNKLECLAGCDGVGGTPLPRAKADPSATVAGAVASPTSHGGTPKVTILRGTSRTKSYSVQP